MKSKLYRPIGVPFPIKGRWYMFKESIKGEVCQSCYRLTKPWNKCALIACMTTERKDRKHAILVRCTLKGIEYTGESSYTRFDKPIDLPIGEKFYFEGIKVSFEKESIFGSPCDGCVLNSTNFCGKKIIICTERNRKDKIPAILDQCI